MWYNLIVNIIQRKWGGFVNLKKIIKEKGLKTGYLAEKLHLSYTSLKNKIRGEVEFKTTEIALLKEELGLTNEEISSIFFEKNSEYNSLK